MNPLYVFIPLAIIFLVLAVKIIIIIASSKSELEVFRSRLSVGDFVLIDDNTSSFVAQITSVQNNYVRVIKASGKTSVYGLNCVYPLN